jgi:hypothetical protein
MRRILLVSLAALAAASTARADAGDAWAFAKGALPADANYVVGINIDALRATSLFTDAVSHFVDRLSARQTIDQIKSACAIDVTAAVQGIVIAAGAASDDGAVYVAGPRLDAKTVGDCMTKFAAQSAKKPKIGVGGADAQGIVELTAEGETSKLYFGFPRKGVMVIAMRPMDKKLLQRWLGGKGAAPSSELARALAKVAPASAAWGVIAGLKEPIGDPGARVKLGAAQATAAGGKVQIEIRATMVGAKDAQNGQQLVQNQIGEMRKDQGTPPEILRAADTLKTSVTGDELTVTASMPDADVAALMKQMQ